MKTTKTLAPAMSALVAMSALAVAGCGGGRGAAVKATGDGATAGSSAPVASGGDRAAAGASTPVASGGDIVLGSALPAGQLVRIGALQLSHAGAIRQVGVGAGGLIVSAGGSHVRVWDPATGALRWQSFQARTVARFALSADGRFVAALHGMGYSRTGRVVLAEIGGRELRTWSVGLAEDLAFSPDGSKLAVAGDGVELFGVADGRRLATLKLLAQAVRFTADGAVLLVSGDAVRRWTWSASKVEIALTFAAPPAAVALARDGAAVAWAAGPTVEVARLDGDGWRGQITAPAPVQSLALSPLVDAVAVGWEKGMGVWGTGEPPSQKWQLRRKLKAPVALAFSGTGQTLIAGDDGRISSLHADRGAYGLVPEARTSFLYFAEDGSLSLWKGSASELLDPRTGERRPGDGLPADAPEWISSFAYGAGGVAMAWDLIDASSCEPLKVWLRGAGERTFQAGPRCGEALDEEWILGPGFVGTAGSAPAVWDVVKQRLLLRIPRSPRPRIGVSFSANRRWMVVARGPEPLLFEDGEGAEGESEGVTFGVPHVDENEPRFKTHLLEVIDLAAARPDVSWQPARQLTWAGDQVALGSVAILNDGTIFAGADDGAVLAATPAQKELYGVARMGGRVDFLVPSPGGAAVAATDEDGLTVLLTAEVTKAAGGRRLE